MVRRSGQLHKEDLIFSYSLQDEFIWYYLFYSLFSLLILLSVRCIRSICGAFYFWAYVYSAELINLCLNEEKSNRV